MAKVLESPATGAGEVQFELDRFERKDNDRLEVAGRWFGVRGRRFIRPTLMLVGDNGERWRALADLAHKPWLAEDGQPWEASFACELDGAELLEAELAVAPDIAIPLPLGGSRSAPARIGAPRREDPARARDAAERELARVQSEVGGLRAALERATTAAAEAESAREQALAELERAAAERESAGDAAHARDRAFAERDQALRALEAAVAERDRTARERDQALAEREQAVAERDRAVGERDQALRARDRALAQRDATAYARDDAVRGYEEVRAQRDQALRERDRLLSERDTLTRSSEKLQSERDEAISARGAALVMRNATRATPAHRHDVGLLRRALAVIVLLAVLVALAAILHVL